MEHFERVNDQGYLKHSNTKHARTAKGGRMRKIDRGAGRRGAQRPAHGLPASRPAPLFRRCDASAVQKPPSRSRPRPVAHIVKRRAALPWKA